MLISAPMDKANSTYSHDYTLHGEAEMTRFASALGGYMRGGECLLLSGTLGTGKTTFARGLIRALCGEQTEVVSPTFMLVQQYDGRSGGVDFPLWHFDLYRLQQPEELWELGLDEVLGHALVLVEWPEIAEDYWPDDHIALHIDHCGEDNAARRLQVTAQGSMVAVLQNFNADWENSHS